MNIVVVGPIPPPIDGRAQASQWLIDALRGAGHRVTVVNTHVGPVGKALRCLRAAATFILQPRPDYVVVVASGQSGLLAEAVPLFTARLRRIPSSLTHHSAHYVRGKSRFLELALAVGGPGLRHAVLDRSMGAELARRYAIETKRVVVVDNAGLMPVPPTPNPPTRRSGVVHLSNLSPAKGLGAVLDVAARTDCSVKLIGSIDATARSILEDARCRGVRFETLGPLHGEAKHRALLDARCFLFLSSYHHEAQPLVLYEAVAAGCVPVVWCAGWVEGQMERMGLEEYALAVGDVTGAARLVEEIAAMDDASFMHLSRLVRAAFEARHSATAHQFHSVVEQQVVDRTVHRDTRR